MSNEHNGNGSPPPQPPSAFVSQPKLLPPLRNASLHHKNNQQSKKDSDSSRPSMPAAATAAAVAVRLGRGHNLFLRNQPSTSSNYSSSTNSYSTTQPTSVTPSITTNGYHTPSNGSGGGYHRQHLRARGGIYATTTTAQQDIVRLERDLEKLLLRPHGRHRQAGLSTGIHNTLDSHQNNRSSNGNNINDHHQENGNRRNLFMRYSRADLMGGGSHGDVLNEDVRTDQTRIAAIMGSILEVVERHKLATQLPFAGDILGVLSVPFSQSPINVIDCQQALDIFDYIRERFKQLDPIDNFEQIMFCCRLLKLGQLKLKMRLVATLKLMLAPCMGNPNFLPSSFAAFHALVYTLVDAFSSTSSSLTNTALERPHSRHEEEFDHIQSSILDLLDKLSNGNIIPLVGMEWDRYFIIPQYRARDNDDNIEDDDFINKMEEQNNDTIPVLVARFCVVEALCRSLMPNTRSDKLDPTSKATVGKLIIEKFLPRYWQEPSTQLEPAYTIILYVLSECATDWFINATSEELRQPSSPVALLLNFVQEKLTVSCLQTFLPDWHDNDNQQSVYINTVSMILSVLSVTSLKEPQPNSLRSSPNHSPRPSSAYNIDSATWPPPPSPSFEDSIRDRLSTKSGGESKSDFFAWRHTVCTLKSYFESFWNSPLNDIVIQVIIDTINDGAWDQVTQMYENLAFNMVNDEEHSIGEKIVHATLSAFLDRLVSTYPTPTPALSHLLHRLSETYRTAFYRPVITCAASDDEHKIATQLTIITCLRKYLSGVQFWMQDAEMINVVLLSDLGSKKAAKEKAAYDGELALMKWGSTTLGQCVIAMEFMWSIKELREKQSDLNRDMEEDEIAKKFLIDLERRLAVFMTAKEKLVLIPIPLRVILCNIFRDARFFCNTTHRPGWLSRAIDWATQPVATAEFFRDTNHCNINNNNNDDENEEDNTCSPTSTPDDRKAAAAAARTSAILHHHYLDDVTLMFQRIRITYAMTVDQLESETNEVLEYGDRPVSALPRSSPPSHATPLSTTNTTTTSSPMEDLIDTLVTTSVENESTNFPVHTKRRQYMAEMYPISRAAAASLDLNPPHPPNVILASKIARKRLEDMPLVHQDPFGAVFSLLVAVFTSLTSHEFGRLVYPLWERYIDDRNPRAFVPAAFLLMQCAEKVPKNVVEAFTHDFYSDPFRRLSAVEKQASLAGYRFNILSQEYIPTSSRKRPFRGDGGAFSTPFVPTDLGSNRFTMDEPRWMAKLKHASNFPIELKRQIQELGWDDDDQGEEHEALKKVLTPLALLPSFYLEEEEEPNDGGDGSGLGGGRGENESRHINVSKIIARRKRAATVHALTSANLSMVDLLGDDFGGVSSALRELLEVFLRDDPALFLRPFLGDLGKSKISHQRELLTRLRYLVDLRSKLPPGFSYILFNYLAGMLKWLTRENKEDGLVLMTLIHPILAELALSTNELSTRDLRKSKIEHLLASTGRFWFTNEQPSNMFPRELTDTRTPFSILDIPWDIFSVAVLRISHIQFLTNFLARYPREVYAVKKTLQDYEPLVVSLPQDGYNGPAYKKKKRASFQPGAPDTYFPDISLRKRRDTTFVFEEEERQANTKLDVLKPVPRISQQEEDIGLLSALRARVWLRFIDTLLLGLNKNYNDRNELERILKGVNMIIMEHNMDFEIIGQALILYTRVVTKFKRLFLGSRGHGIFLPALFKVFCEVERFSHVRSAITFAWCRFYAVHEETFVFQMLGALVPIILNAYDKSISLGAWMTDNLFTLMQSMHNPPRLGATSDVLGLQLQVELDDHERSVQERIDAASNPMAMPLSTTILKPLARSVTAPIVPLVVSDYDNRPFLLQNFVKLFLTIIAYDPGSLRAEQFVKMMRHMLPRFCVLGNLTGLISEGIAALIEVFAKFSKNAKPVAATANTGSHSGAPHINIAIPHFFEDRSNNSNGAPGASGGYDASAGLNSSNNNNNNNTSRAESTQHAYGKQWQQNDRLTIKKEFVLLVDEFFKCHGVLTEPNHEKMANIIRIIMRDYASIRGAICPTDWIKSYLVDALQSMVDMRNYTKSFKTMLLQIYAQLRTQWKTVELADIYEGFAIILENGQGKAINMNDIAGLMKDKFVSFGLSIATRFSDWESGQEAHTKFCNVLVRLIVAIMENSNQDVLCEIEQMQPSVLLIGKIIIPMCLQYDLHWDYNSIPVVRRYRPEPTANWMRLMAYVSKSCSQASLLKSKSSGFSLSALTSNIGQTTSGGSGGGAGQRDSVGGGSTTAVDIGEVLSDPKDKKQQTPTAIAHLFSLSIVAMKVILLRGAKSLDKVRGSWVQVAYFLKGALIFGQTLKTMKPRSGRSTPRMPLSPGLSPPSAFPPPSPITPDSNHTSFLQNNINTNSGSTNSNIPLSTAILYDYATWCFLEFVVCYKSPLKLFLRSFLDEKLNEMGSRVSPSGSRSNSMLNSPSSMGSRRSNRWKSWGQNDTGAESLEGHQQQPDSSPTCGLGLHIPSNKPPVSPSLSVHPPSIDSSLANEAAAGSPRSPPRSPRSPSYQRGSSNQRNRRPTSGGNPASTELHIIHAETITALMNIQNALGYKTTLPWGTDHLQNHTQQQAIPWTYRAAVSKVSYEWRLIMQLYSQLVDASMTSSSNKLPTTPTTTS